MIGAAVREIRKEKNITIKELADMVNVTSGYISQIERDLIEPSLSVLRRLSEALEVPMAVFFSMDSSGDVALIPKDKRTRIKFPDINMEYEFMTPYDRKKGNQPKMEVIYYKLAPRSWGSNDAMVHAADECTIVLKGTLEYHVGDRIYVVEEGSSIYISENTTHQLYNPTDTEVEAIGIITPGVY